MLTLHAAAATLILNSFAPAVAPLAFATGQFESANAHNASACPIAAWGGRCALLSEAQRQKIRTVVAAHANLGMPTCQTVHDLLVELLEDLYSQIWTFEQHQYDATGTYVMGQAVRGAMGEPHGIGLRVTAFRSRTRTLARAVLHEAAHLTGQDENGAVWVERHCVS